MKTKKQTAILYARVAVKTENQKPDRLQFQLDKLNVYCQDFKVEAVAEFSEVASGGNFERTEFQKMLGQIKSGKLKADLLLFTDWSRFTRDLLFSGRKMVNELEKLGIKPMAIDDKINARAIYKILKHQP